MSFKSVVWSVKELKSKKDAKPFKIVTCEVPASVLTGGNKMLVGAFQPVESSIKVGDKVHCQFSQGQNDSVRVEIVG